MNAASSPFAERVGWARRNASLLAAAVLCAFLVVEMERAPTEPLAEGDVAPRTVRAPYPFTYTDEGARSAAQAAAVAAARPVFLLDAGLMPEVAARLTTAFRTARAAHEEGGADLDAVGVFLRDAGVVLSRDVIAPLQRAGFPEEAADTITGWLQDAYGDRLVLSDRSALPADGGPVRIVPEVGDRPAFLLQDPSRIVSPEELRHLVGVAASRDRGGRPWARAAEAVALALAQPNLFFDAERTEAARREAADSVASSEIQVKRGETLFREGDRLGAREVAVYRALQSGRTPHGIFAQGLAACAFLVLVFGILQTMARRFLRGVPEDPRDLAATAAMVVVVAAAARLVVTVATGAAPLLGGDVPPAALWFLVPLAGGAMVVRLLMGLVRAAVYVVAATVVMALLMRLDALYALYFLLTSLAAAALVEGMRERIAALRVGVVVGLLGAALAAGGLLARAHLDGQAAPLSQTTLITSVVSAFAGGMLSGFFVLGVVPVFEAVGFVTDYRMMELASLNHPLLRQLMLRAPGTYHHSVVVGTLAEAGCEAIGANSLQAKISAYFHDIGKALKPHYFIENQRGGHNRHNDLDARQSAAVIIGHVTHGARLAREHHLPKPILDNILMHHGTGLLQYFYAKAAAEALPGESVDEAAFRYPGPKPNTREAGVVMLADKVEAATRTIHQPNEGNIRAMINRIISSVMADDQFSECPLTFREIHIIADTFVRVLLGIHHQRIEYPQTAGISVGQEPRRPAPLVNAPTITVELDPEVSAAARASSQLWTDGPDDITDYESVRHLPHLDD